MNILITTAVVSASKNYYIPLPTGFNGFRLSRAPITDPGGGFVSELKRPLLNRFRSETVTPDASGDNYN
jgi:hypothetical protein